MTSLPPFDFVIRIDPRNPLLADLVHTESEHQYHRDIYKTLVLLRIDTIAGNVFFVVEGLLSFTADREEAVAGQRYFYNEHTCPTNFIRIPLIAENPRGGKLRLDPHGVLEFVDFIWMTTEYVAADEGARSDDYLVAAFPQMLQNLPA